MPERDLTIKQERFVHHYLGDAHGNATQAAQLAGYQGEYSSVASQGSAMLKRPYIARAIREILDEEGISAQYVLRRLKIVTDMDPRDFFHAGRDSKASLADYVRGCELFGKALRMFVDTTETTNTEVRRIEITSIRVADDTPTIDSTAQETDTDTTQTQETEQEERKTK